ncbi:hypothetical protein D4R78_06110 [bacterium]|nr:MAG: hypothetical protein D4R78_06110 [bacterium]
MNENKLKDRCCVLRKCIISLSDIYHDTNTNEDQKRLIETMIGAAIWYLPNDLGLWTGKVSEEALKLINQGTPISKLTKEHEFPRKLAAKEVLTSELNNLNKSEPRLFELYTTKYGKWNLVTPKENKILGQFQKDTIFVSSHDSYSKAGIKLIEVDKSVLQKRFKVNDNVEEIEPREIKGPIRRNIYSKSTDKINIVLNNLHSAKAYSLIPLPKELRHLFPGFKIEFELETDVGMIVTKVTSAPRGTEHGDLVAGNYIQGGLKRWYDSHPELKNGTTLIISVIESKKKYSLSIK